MEKRQKIWEQCCENENAYKEQLPDKLVDKVKYIFTDVKKDMGKIKEYENPDPNCINYDALCQICFQCGAHINALDSLCNDDIYKKYEGEELEEDERYAIEVIKAFHGNKIDYEDICRLSDMGDMETITKEDMIKELNKYIVKYFSVVFYFAFFSI